jgi:hypothetical protein
MEHLNKEAKKRPQSGRFESNSEVAGPVQPDPFDSQLSNESDPIDFKRV